jgi:hypothetical protein
MAEVRNMRADGNEGLDLYFAFTRIPRSGRLGVIIMGPVIRNASPVSRSHLGE